MRILTVFFCLVGLVLNSIVYADSVTEQNIRKGLEGIIPDVEVTSIKPTPVENLYEVLIGPDVVYMTGDGRFVFKGDLLDLKKRRNLSEEKRSAARKGILTAQPANEIIEFAPKKTDYVVYVFTDVDCTYCRRLHRDVPVLNDNGVAIRYLAYPRAGIGSQAFNVMQAVWCSDDRKQAMTNAKNGKQVELKQCANPVEKQYLLGQELGVRGTPAIYLENGKSLPGYLPPDELIKLVKK
jgi:thiol:disulfide interchange protein DsbC